MDKRPLTATQREVLSWIEEQYQQHGEFPSVREIQDAFDYKSTNSPWQILNALRKKGYLIKRHDTYDFAPEHYFITAKGQKALRAFVTELLDTLESAMQDAGVDEDVIYHLRREKRAQFDQIWRTEIRRTRNQDT